MARLRASPPRRNPRQSRDLSDRTPAAISARSRSRRASGAVRPRSTPREGAFCCAKHRACLWRPVRCRRIVRASSARMPTAATAIDACSERQRQTAGSRAPKAASAEVGGRRQSDLRGWRASTRAGRSFPFRGGLFGAGAWSSTLFGQEGNAPEIHPANLGQRHQRDLQHVDQMLAL